ncbi:MAG: hypothetical protein WBX16_21285 [Candidatus Acidiferrales bacterium]
MNSAATAFAARRAGSGMAIVWAGLTCGAMDITAALVVYGLVYGVPPVHLLQGIAAGLLGRAAFQGGAATAALGLFCQFVIAFGAAAVYFALSRKISFLLRRAVVSGVLYGVAVYFFMQLVVVRYSAAVKYPFQLKLMIIGIVIHVFCVGLPIALMVRKYATRYV